MKEKEIIQNLNSFRPKPSKRMLDSFSIKIKNLDNDVTDVKNNRNSFLKVFNFFYFSNMSGTIKSLLSILSVVITLGAGSGAVYASNSATPGDMLFPVDKAVEQVQRIFFTDPTKKSEFELVVMDERISELSQVTEEGSTDAVTDAISEVEDQQIKLQERLREMDQLRSQDKLQTQEQLKVMEQLKTKIQTQEKMMGDVQIQLKSSGDTQNSESLMQLQTDYNENLNGQLETFEEDTGISVEESVQNQGEDTQIQINNGIQNKGEVTGSGSTSGSNSPSTGSQNTNTIQGK